MKQHLTSQGTVILHPIKKVPAPGKVRTEIAIEDEDLQSGSDGNRADSDEINEEIYNSLMASISKVWTDFDHTNGKVGIDQF